MLHYIYMYYTSNTYGTFHSVLSGFPALLKLVILVVDAIDAPVISDQSLAVNVYYGDNGTACCLMWLLFCHLV